MDPKPSSVYCKEFVKNINNDDGFRLLLNQNLYTVYTKKLKLFIIVMSRQQTVFYNRVMPSDHWASDGTKVVYSTSIYYNIANFPVVA